jgi:transposase
MSPVEDPKARFLASRGALHPHPERVRDPLFQRSDFFDPRDLVQVRYEALRRHRVDGQAVAGVARAFGMSRQLFYILARAFREGGLPGLLPRKRGPRRARKGTDAILAYVAGRRAASPGCPTRALVDDVSREFGVRLHRRTLERGLARRGKGRRGRVIR